MRFIVNELGYSRRFHFWCTDSLDAEHTYEGIIRSLEYFGGVTEEVLVDNQKSAVLQASNQGQPRFNERFLDLADHYGFTPRACRPYRARTKGKDERMVGYVKQHFFVRYRSFESWAHLNQLAEHWLAEEADRRVQGTVKGSGGRAVRAANIRCSRLCQRSATTRLTWSTAKWAGMAISMCVATATACPSSWSARLVVVRISLEDELRSLSCATSWLPGTACRAASWAGSPPLSIMPPCGRARLNVEQRPLETYEEVSQWS